MPRTETVLQAFVASPSDVADERSILEDVVRELNLTWSKSLGLRVELVKWETHAYPAVGEDAQQIINNQLGDEYDIFIGVMWSRFGTPTGRYGSGTEEEFERAFAKWKANSDSVHVMFYFKDAGLQPSQIDLKQLSSVMAFLDKLGPKGTLYWTYTTKEEFAQLLRVHLSRVVQSWKKNSDSKGEDSVTSNAIVKQSNQVETKTDESDDEAGFLDAILISQDRFQELAVVTTRMTEATNELAAKIDQRSSEMAALSKDGKITDLKAAMQISNRSAADMVEFASRIEVELPLYSQTARTAIESMTQAANLLSDFKTDDGNEFGDGLESVLGLLNGMNQLREGNTRFMEIIASLPRVTSTFHKARRRVLNCLKKLDAEISAIQNMTMEMVKLLEDLVRKSSQNAH